MPAAEKLTPRRGFPVSGRLCVLINESHGGNVRQAAAAIGCDYDALWRAVSGRSRGANLDMLRAVATYYAVSVESLIS